MQIDLSDKKLYDLVQRSDNKTIKPSKQIVKNNININENKNKNEKIIPVKNCKKEGSLFKFIRNLFIIVVCLFLIYITVFRYVLGYNFFKNKDYMKTSAVLSPELITISTLLI
jgi:hypothetical protein